MLFQTGAATFEKLKPHEFDTVLRRHNRCTRPASARMGGAPDANSEGVH